MIYMIIYLHLTQILEKKTALELKVHIPDQKKAYGIVPLKPKIAECEILCQQSLK